MFMLMPTKAGSVFSYLLTPTLSHHSLRNLRCDLDRQCCLRVQTHHCPVHRALPCRFSPSQAIPTVSCLYQWLAAVEEQPGLTAPRWPTKSASLSWCCWGSQRWASPAWCCALSKASFMNFRRAPLGVRSIPTLCRSINLL